MRAAEVLRTTIHVWRTEGCVTFEPTNPKDEASIWFGKGHFSPLRQRTPVVSKVNDNADTTFVDKWSEAMNFNKVSGKQSGLYFHGGMQSDQDENAERYELADERHRELRIERYREWLDDLDHDFERTLLRLRDLHEDYANAHDAINEQNAQAAKNKMIATARIFQLQTGAVRRLSELTAAWALWFRSYSRSSRPLPRCLL